MSAPVTPSPAPAVPPAGTIRCPRCDATVGPEQDWCLACGAPARTRLAPTPNWRAPVLLVALVIALSGIALAVAFVELTGGDEVTAADTVSVATQTPTGPTNPALPPAQATTPAPPPVTTATASAPATATDTTP